jgi:lipopolysaccharide export system protein LptA
MKRSEAARYASWSALAALLLASITGGIYLRRQWVAHLERTKAPPPLAENQERQSIGLTVSRGEGDRTVFTVQASKSTDIKGADVSLLEDVNVTVFGKLGDRHDVIHTQSCRYAKTNGGIECSGDVQFDLESAADAARVKNEGVKPNIIHVQTSGVIFNAKSGKAETSQPVKFQMPDGDGEGIGGTYLSEEGILRLEKNVRVTLHQTGALAIGKKQDAPSSNVILHGTSMEMGKKERQVVLAGPATATTPTQELAAGQLVVLLDEENRAQTLIAEPGKLDQTPQLTAHGGTGPTGNGTLRADLMTAHLVPAGWVRTMDATGNVQGKSESGEMQADTANVEMWSGLNQAKILTLHGNVHMNQRDPKTGTDRKLVTTVLQMNFAGGKAGEPNPVQHAETLARGTMDWNDTPTSQSKLSADKLAVDFGAAGKAKDLIATGNVETERKIEGKPTQTATSATGEAQLDAGGAWTQITLRGNVHMKEGDRTAEAHQAVFERVPPSTVLTGQAVAQDESSITRATKITFHQDTGDIEAEGKVRSTDLGNSPDSIHLSPMPSNATSEHMVGNSKTGRALYTGQARMWQGQSVLEADSIELLRPTRMLNAKGNVRAVFPKEESESNANAGAKNKGSKGVNHNKDTTKEKDDKELVVWHVTAGALTYWDLEDRAHLEKNVVVQSENERMRGPVLDLYFTREPDRKNGAQNVSPKSPQSVPQGTSKISRAVGTGGVEVEQLDRRGTAEKGVYTAVDDRFVLSGGTPTLYDEDGKTMGRELTFNIADDTIIVDSDAGKRTLTRHRVQR